MKWIKWTQWESGGCIGIGQMPGREVEKNLQEFEKQAAKVLKETGADHVVYGMKLYDEDGELEEVKFYMVPIDDEKFQKDVASLSGCVIYALHARR
ncbi:MAG: hypothetical protein IKJ99_03675 [Oscillospiraceae bacterium]|nr:hypothetical protein [Oscillospiraceae bacterium]